jgi:hypothetical protein
MAFDIKKEIAKLNKKAFLNATNELGSTKIFYKRSLFKKIAYTSEPANELREELLPIRDFQRFENYLYGRINTDFNAVIPKKNFLIPIDDEDKFSFDFVELAFRKMKDRIQQDIADGKLENDIPFISEMKVYNSFDDINVEYNRWVKEVIKESFPAYVKKFNKKEKITDFESFMVVFKEHLMMIADQLDAVTFSSFCLISNSNIRNSGLCIEIADLDFSKDSDKIDFASERCFPYYVGVAEKHGFFVDYNAPWRLIINLASPVITGRPSWGGLKKFFNNYYKNASNKDLEILKNVAFTTYRDFIRQFPSFKMVKVDPVSGCITRTRVKRQKFKNNQLDEDYPENYWISLYIDLKNVEKNLNYAKHELARIKKNALEYEKYVDIHRVMRYINSVFQDIPSLEGSYYWEFNKKHYRDQSPLPFEDFDKYIQEIVKSYREELG